MKYSLYTTTKKLLADTLTPVNLYLKLRDVHAGTILLESSDYHGHENSLSFICCKPTSIFKVEGNAIETRFPDGRKRRRAIEKRQDVVEELESFRNSFTVESEPGRYPVGFFGYTTFDAVRFFEEVDLKIINSLVPDMIYSLYQYVIVIDHFSNELTLVETGLQRQTDSGIDDLEKIIFSNRFPSFPFNLDGEEISAMNDADFLDLVEQGKQHCHRGDVFQVVMSRRFSRAFHGDEFNVYRSLRSINPSPYLFYFDYGNFRLFGSSPEAQLQIKGRKASILPIAGTFRRTGNDREDLELAKRLAADEKENAEHVMLVDLARNDLSKEADRVTVEVFREIQYYSHVIHLVSRVTGNLRADASPLRLAIDTFPAGTLSGAPKHRALQLINQYEPVNRSFYGGAIGFMGLNGDYNHAIMIRTFLSKNNNLICQAGAGVVAKSDAGSELKEVNSKLEALRRALVMAEKI